MTISSPQALSASTDTVATASAPAVRMNFFMVYLSQ
jgi:hypothetical protein